MNIKHYLLALILKKKQEILVYINYRAKVFKVARMINQEVRIINQNQSDRQ